MLTKEQVVQYRRDGYLVVENVLTAVELKRARDAVDEMVEQSRDMTEKNEVFELEPDHSPAQPRLRRIRTPVLHHPAFDAVLRSPRLLDAVEPLIGPNIRYHGSKLNMKAAGGGTPVEWHQDFAFYPHTNDDLLACGVALDDCDLDNGCLLVIPGSHREKLLDHHDEAGNFVGAVDATLPEIAEERQVPVVLRAGSMSVHHVRLLHGSAPNNSDRQRRLLLLELAAADAFPIQRMIPWETFDRSLLRGSDPQRARMIEADDLRPPRFTVHATSIFELQAHSRKANLAGAGD